MFSKKSLKLNFISDLSLLLALQLFTTQGYTQQLEPQSSIYSRTDTTSEKPVQYRRGISSQEGYQSYEEKYLGKNLNEEKEDYFLYKAQVFGQN